MALIRGLHTGIGSAGSSQRDEKGESEDNRHQQNSGAHQIFGEELKAFIDEVGELQAQVLIQRKWNAFLSMRICEETQLAGSLLD